MEGIPGAPIEASGPFGRGASEADPAESRQHQVSCLGFGGGFLHIRVGIVASSIEGTTSAPGVGHDACPPGIPKFLPRMNSEVLKIEEQHFTGLDNEDAFKSRSAATASMGKRCGWGNRRGARKRRCVSLRRVGVWTFWSFAQAWLTRCQSENEDTGSREIKSSIGFTSRSEGSTLRLSAGRFEEDF